MSSEYFEIHPGYTYYAPDLTWVCGLKYTNVRLTFQKEERINISDKIQLDISGGLVSLLGHCHAKSKK